ncbi:hypothetical protein Taro_043760 [Colocasia esculenta]|uniref:Uncharacterized protein n=1 Tax=Colocasia esculenta TaxID=4460 RepID=A0A843WZH3_COLES|nr:hypothetical protein [Colocasia esculenta]
MASAEMEASSGVHVIQLVETNGGGESPRASVEEAAPTEEEISPLLPDAQGRPNMSIFSVSYPSNRRRPPKAGKSPCSQEAVGSRGNQGLPQPQMPRSREAMPATLAGGCSGGG